MSPKNPVMATGRRQQRTRPTARGTEHRDSTAFSEILRRRLIHVLKGIHLAPLDNHTDRPESFSQNGAVISLQGPALAGGFYGDPAGSSATLTPCVRSRSSWVGPPVLNPIRREPGPDLSLRLLKAMEAEGLLEKAVGIRVPKLPNALLMGKISTATARSGESTSTSTWPIVVALTKAAKAVPAASRADADRTHVLTCPMPSGRKCVSYHDGNLPELLASGFGMEGVSRRRIDRGSPIRGTEPPSGWLPSLPSANIFGSPSSRTTTSRPSESST